MHRSGRLAAAALSLLALAACSDAGQAGPPLASAGPGGSVPKRAYVMLDGSGSRPAHGDSTPLRYAWRQVAGTSVGLSDPGAVTPVFLSPGVGGVLTFELVVTGRRPSEPATVSFLVENHAPYANAGPDLSARAEWLASVRALESFDPDGDPLTYTWIQTAGPAVVLDDQLAGIARFTVPAVVGTLSFAVVVSDGEASAMDEVSVRIYPPGANLPPTADAGPDQNVAYGATTFLWGSGSDPDGFPVALSWTQTSGPPVVLAGSGTGGASFVAPSQETTLEFELTVSDGVDAATDTLVVNVGAPAPVITSLSILPEHPRTAHDLAAAVEAYTPGLSTPPALAFAWTRNGTPVVDQTNATYPAALTAKGDVIAVRVTATEGSRQTSREVSATIEDSPPVATLTGPGEVAHGAPFTGSVTVSDPDGDPSPAGALALAYGPAGMDLAADGALTWTPTLPMFDRALDVRFGITVAGGAPLPGTLHVSDPARAPAMRRAGFEIPASAEAVLAKDLDGDGRDDLLVAGLSGLYVMEASATGYAITWMTPFRDPGDDANGWGFSTAVEALDVTGDGAAELFHGTRRDLVRYDGATHRETGRVSFSEAERFLACEAADLDRDGPTDLVCLLSADSYENTSRRLVVLDPAMLAVRWTTAQLPLGGSLAVGNVDGDAALELVTSGGFVFDGATHANEWTHGPGFGTFVGIGRLQVGGTPVIVGGAPLRGFSATLKSPLWEYTGGAVPFLLRDVNGDGDDELIGFSDYALRALDYVGGSTVLSPSWTATTVSSFFGTRALTAGDLDGDGEVELVWDDGATHTGEDSLVVGGPLSAQLAVEWQNVNPSQLDGPMLGGYLARTAAGVSRLVFQSVGTDSGYEGARLVLLDPETGILDTSPEIGTNWAGGGGLAVGDYDADGIDEVFVGTASHYDGYFAAWDPATATVTWTSPQATSSDAPAAVRAADLSGDGHPDMVGLTNAGVIWVWDVRNASLVWKSTSLGAANALEIVELDGAGRPEIVVGAGTRIVVYRWSDAAGLFLEAASAAIPGTDTWRRTVDLAAGDCDGDGTPEVYALVGSSFQSSAVVVYDATLRRLGEFTLPVTASSLHVEDLGTSRKNLAVSLPVGTSTGYGGEPHVLAAIDPSTGDEIWRSPLLFGAVPRDSVSWIQQGGRWHLVLGTDRSMVMTR